MTAITTRPTLRQDERGIALAIAIFALVIIATLVTGVFFMARLEQRSGTNALWSIQAQEAADAGLSATLASWPSAANAAPLGVPQTLAMNVAMGGNIRYTTTVTKMSDQIFLVQSRGERTDAGTGVLSGVTVGRIVRTITPNFEVDAAVTANGPVRHGGNAVVDGRDTNPEYWAECVAGDPVAGIRTSDFYYPDGKGSPPELHGDPKLVVEDGSVTTPWIMGLFDQFKKEATIFRAGNWGSGERPTPEVDANDKCTTTDLNWGDPWRQPKPNTVVDCTGRAPIIHITGNADISGAGGGKRGQGILLVEGDLSLTGNFEFTGIVIVLGNVKTSGTGGSKILGALISENADIGDETWITGNPHVVYSSCAVSTVLGLAMGRARPLDERSWVQLY